MVINQNNEQNQEKDNKSMMLEKEVIRLAKRWHDSQTEYNRIQFITVFNELDDDTALALVRRSSELSRILPGWVSATRMEMGELL